MTWWIPGEPEDDLHGFLTKEDRDAFEHGDPGPFQRIVRDHHKLGPLSPEVRFMREWLDNGRTGKLP